MTKQKSQRTLIALTGAVAFLAVAVKLAVAALNQNRRRRNNKEIDGVDVRVNLSASEILKLADRVIAESKRVHDRVASVPVDKVSYQDVIALAELEARIFPLVQSCIFSRLVSTSEDVRKASVEAEQQIDLHFALCSKREDVYRVVKAFASRKECMSDESKSFIQCLVRDFERNGLSLTLPRRQEVQNLRAQMDELSMQYAKNLHDDCTFLLFTKTDLDGLPSEFLESLGRPDDGSFKVRLRSNIVSPVLEHCKVGETRRKLASEYGRRCKEANMPVLENLVQLRHKLARLLGYKNYVDYAVEFRMAETSSRVFDVLEKISVSLAAFAARELGVLKDLKNKEEGGCLFGVEDLLYYIKRAEEKEFDVDFASLKQYFPLDLVLHGVFKIMQDILGLRFDEISDALVWHSDVQMYSVSDSSSCEILGYAYFDLYSREGKFSHSCVVSLQNGSLLSSGARQVPVVLLISNFHKEVGGQPGLLRFSEVVHLFHEFGHVVHHICNRSSFVRFSGLRVDPDFKEIPSQVFESWCFESSILKLISGFHQDITRTVRDDICALLKKWQHSFAALKLRQEILYCLFDQIIHSDDNVDFLELFKRLHPEIMLGLPMLDGTSPASCFPHSAIGYDATCYSRLWSKVFAADIFASKFHDGLLNKSIGIQFRSKVLAPGGAKNPTESLSDFLGREPSIQAFVDNIVLSNSA